MREGKVLTAQDIAELYKVSGMLAALSYVVTEDAASVALGDAADILNAVLAEG